MTRKTINLGEYIIKIKYEKETGRLDVNVFDELGDHIEGIIVEESSDEDDESSEIGFNLN